KKINLAGRTGAATLEGVNMRYLRLQSVVMACSLLIAGAFVCCNVAITPAYAQTNISGDVSGTVTDPSGASIVGATVTLTSKSTGEVSQAKTSSTGSFRISLLKPGEYVLKVSSAGFRDTAAAVTV